MTSRTKSRSRGQKRSRKNDEIFEGLDVNRTGEYVRVDDELIKRLGGADQQPEQPNPLRDYPEFLQIVQKERALTLDQLDEYSQELNEDFLATKMGEMLGNLPVDYLALKRSNLVNNDWEYNVKLPVKARVADQMHSGRCWLFAALGQIRLHIIQKHHLDNRFELSQGYLFFYDKLERANAFLESVWAFRDRGINSRDWLSLVQPNNHMMTDGGHYSYFVNLIQKYGIVPKNVYDDGFNAKCTDGMNNVLIQVLNHMALQINGCEWTEEEFQLQKNEWMSTIYQLVVKFLGKPPTPDTVFNWNYRDSDDNSHTEPGMTAIKFFQIVADAQLESKVLIIHDPRHPETYYMTSLIPYSVNRIGGVPVNMLNLPLEDFKSAICQSLQAEEAVWFASDIGHAFDPEDNTADPDRFDYEGLLGVDFNFSKSDMLNSRTSAPNHALLFIGVDTVKDGEGNVLSYKKWRVENSWGMMNLLEDDPDSGYCRFSDSYVDKYVSQAVVDMKFLPPHVLEQLLENANAGRSYVYDPYDVFGAVAMFSPCQHCKKASQKFQRKY